MTIKPPPDSFLRFYGDPEFTLDCIENKQLTLIHTSKFNDPFDPILDFVLECNWDYDLFIQWIQQNRPQLDALNIEQYRQGWQSSKAKLEEYFSSLRATMFAACFCTGYTNNDGTVSLPQDNLYMWGHYGNGHRGAAIEFKKDTFVSRTGKVGIEYIEYRDALPVITNEELYEYLFNQNTNPLIAKHGQILRTKTKNWEPEQEWRFSMTNETTKLPWIKTPLPDDSIQSIYLGCQLNSDAADKIIEQARNFHPGSKIFWARLDHKNLRLSFECL